MNYFQGSKNEGMQITMPQAPPPPPTAHNRAIVPYVLNNTSVQEYFIPIVASTKHKIIVALNMQKPFFEVNVKNE